MNKNPMTVSGAEKLREELRYRKSELRPQIIAAVEEARAHGDLKENAEYHAALLSLASTSVMRPSLKPCCSRAA